MPMFRKSNRKYNRAFKENVLDENGKISNDSKDELMQRLNEADEERRPGLTAAENKVLAGTWIQAVGTLLEAQGVTEEYLITVADEGKEGLEAERQAVFGIWLQVIGSFLGAVGAWQQLSPDEQIQRKGLKLGIIGSWFEAFGAATEALAETQGLIEGEEEGVLP